MEVHIHVAHATFNLPTIGDDIKALVAQHLGELLGQIGVKQQEAVSDQKPQPMAVIAPKSALEKVAPTSIKGQVIEQIRRLKEGGMTYKEIDRIIGRGFSTSASSSELARRGSGQVSQETLDKLLQI